VDAHHAGQVAHAAIVLVDGEDERPVGPSEVFGARNDRVGHLPLTFSSEVEGLVGVKPVVEVRLVGHLCSFLGRVG